MILFIKCITMETNFSKTLILLFYNSSQGLELQSSDLD